MMNKGFNVTFERWIESGLYANEPFYRGVVIGDVSLSDALRELAAPPHWPCATEADEWPIRAPRCFLFHDWNENTREHMQDGVREDRCLHVPAHVTPASRRRIARYLGFRVKG
ncbi:MAG: hypothetical protein QOK29_568 [Rhodospirillaceae bacterium]|jgi:hypothetical protein|nr:hypothetical protein [Rhodospirillaceae bacterium]